MTKTLEELRQEIRAERPFVDKKPYSHNIIGLLLRQIAEEHGKDEANRAIRELGLKRLGWAEKP
jgi:hypothetical protein